MTEQPPLPARWPAMMDRQTLAEYLDVSLPSLLKEVASGRIPPPVRFGHREHWHKDAIDRALAVLSGDCVPDYRARFLSGKAA